jgi:hypothetical protein
MNTEKQTTIIEINGVKLEVDLRNAKRIDQLVIGSRVKCLVKRYNDWATYPGVIVGFEPFPTKPTIVVAYLETEYSYAGLKFKSFNADTVDFEVVADLDHNALEVNRESVLQQFDRELGKKELELEEMRQKRSFFLANFGAFFHDKELQS